MQEKQELATTAKALEASLRACHHVVAEYRAMLIAAVKDDPLPETEQEKR
jgi:hypothetical protein